MIHADLLGKSGVSEDRLTSSVFGLLRLLSDSYLIDLLAQARYLDGKQIDIGGMTAVAGLEFWPWLRDGGEPDVITTFAADSSSTPMKIVIEVKHSARKSSGDEDDQLVRYFNAATA